jgi:8-oxo-dGTP pyrophosphatase MutT (NUDIX family)
MKEQSYGVCIYRLRSEVEILLMKPKGGSQWGFIKGKLEKGEHQKECAVRECFEETGIVIDPRDLEHMFYRPTKRKNIGIFLVKEEYVDMTNIVLCPKETEEISWFSFDQTLNDIEIHNNQKKILKDILDYFRSI